MLDVVQKLIECQPFLSCLSPLSSTNVSIVIIGWGYNIERLNCFHDGVKLVRACISDRVWWGMVEYGRVWQSMVEYGRVWWSMVEYGRVWSSMVEYGRVWSSML